MRRGLLSLGFCLAGLVPGPTINRAWAELQLPGRSPLARVSQQVGLTRVTVDYNAPAVAGRKIWSSVATPGVLWRTGEGVVPRISFSREVEVGGALLQPGAYALLTIPSDDEWTIIINRDSKLVGAADYRPDLDVARVKVPWRSTTHRERLAFLFSDFSDDEASLDLEWGDRRVSIPIRTFTRAQIEGAIRDLDGTWRRYADTARYLDEVVHDRELARRYIERSLALAENPYNIAIRDSILDGLGRGGRTVRSGLAASQGPKLVAASAALAPGSAGVVSVPPLMLAAIEPTHAAAAVVRERSVRVRAGRGASSRAKPPGPAEIGPLIRRGRADIERCYERALREEPNLSRARITVSVDIDVSGMVKNVRLEPPHASGTLESCLKGAISRWVFPLSPVEYGTEFPVVLREKE